MVYQVTYKNANGDPLLVATFNADGPKDGLQKMLSVPSLQPPPGTETIEVVTVPPTQET